MIVAALSGTFQREAFNSVLDLIPKCEKLKQLWSICKLCNSPGSFTLRTVESDSVELVGSHESYIPVCRECYNFKTQEAEKRRESKNEMQVIKFEADAEDGDESTLLSISKQSSSADCQQKQSSPDSLLSSPEIEE